MNALGGRGQHCCCTSAVGAHPFAPRWVPRQTQDGRGQALDQAYEGVRIHARRTVLQQQPGERPPGRLVHRHYVLPRYGGGLGDGNACIPEQSVSTQQLLTLATAQHLEVAPLATELSNDDRTTQGPVARCPEACRTTEHSSAVRRGEQCGHRTRIRCPHQTGQERVPGVGPH